MTVTKTPNLNIAITLSGMLRSWNKESYEHVVAFVNFLKDNGHQVDLYGLPEETKKILFPLNCELWCSIIPSTTRSDADSLTK